MADTLKNYELHPLCVLFPRLVGEPFNVLRDDIKVNGLRVPIVLHDGMILDGGNRYLACVEAGVDPVFEKFAGGNLASFVLSANLHRRHLSVGQQAAIVASAMDWSLAQKVGKPKSGNVAALDRVQDRAAQSGASERTQRMADKVAKIDPALATRVAHGDVSLPKAHAAVSVQPVRTPKPVAAAVQQTADDAHDGFDPLEELEKANADIAKLQAELDATQADDLKTEALKWHRLYQVSERKQSELMDSVHRLRKDQKWVADQLRRCGKAVGEEDPMKIARAVETAINGRKAA